MVETETLSLHERVCDIFGIPNILIGWLDRFFEPEECQLIFALGRDNEIPRGSIAPESLPTFERAYARGILQKDADGNFTLADFHVRFEIWALFEGWKDLPADVHDALNAWEFAHFVQQKTALVETAKQGGDPEERSEYLLLPEAERRLDEVGHIYLWPCNCRAMMQRCDQSLNVCLRFNNDRNIGWEISTERAKAIVRDAHRRGLMQLGETRRADDGSVTGGLCNCCADCCFPHRAAEQLDSQKIWPTSRYIAEFTSDRCSGCGRCVRRCPFQAFEQTHTDRNHVVFMADRCRGCGLCATTCPEHAITMIPV